MTAKGQYLRDAPTNFFPHAMFFVATRKGDAEWECVAAARARRV